MPDVFPVDFTSPVGKVRKYIPDLVQLPDPAHPGGSKSYIFSDEELESFLLDEGSIIAPTPPAIIRAAAWAIIALANSENLILKKIVTEDQQTDGPAVARQLLVSADMLFERADRLQISLNGRESFIHVPYASASGGTHPLNTSPYWPHRAFWDV